MLWKIECSAEPKASIGRMKARRWLDAATQAFHQGAIPTTPANVTPAKGQPAMGNPYLDRRLCSRLMPRRSRTFVTDDERIKRRNRKRMLGGSSALPDTIRHHYTEGERAVLCVVAGEVKRRAVCDLSIKEIADRAGVGRTTVQNAMHEGRRQGHLKITERPRRGAKSETNVVEIIATEWRDWIKRAPSAAHCIGFKKESKIVNTSESIDITNTDLTRQRHHRGEKGLCNGVIAGTARLKRLPLRDVGSQTPLLAPITNPDTGKS
jgi:DNA-binding transcriptional regulator YhcF (GntR family)